MSDFKITSPREMQTNNGIETISNSVYTVEDFVYSKSGIAKVNIKAYKSESALQNNALPIESVPPIFLTPDEVLKSIAYLIEQKLESEGFEVINTAILRTLWPEEFINSDVRVFLYSFNALKLAEEHPEFNQLLFDLNIKQVTDINGKWAYLEYLLEEHRELLLLYNAMIQTKPEYNILMGLPNPD